MSWHGSPNDYPDPCMHWLMHNGGRRVWLLLTLLAVAGVIWGVYRWKSQEPDPRTQSQFRNTAEMPPSGMKGDAAKAPTPVDPLTDFMAFLARARTPQDSRMLLARMRAHLATLKPADASKAIRELLDSNKDAPTQLGFIIGPSGFLLEAPSGRVFLLDLLAQLDRPSAASYAEKILNTMTSPDEWAIALRNYALGNTTVEGRVFLEQKLQNLLAYKPWQKQASTGYLEAFDVAVYLGGTRLLPALTTLVRQTENRAASHAAYLALDRLTLSDPSKILGILQAQPEMLQGRETTGANYFARANVEDDTQRNILEKYLLDPRRTAAELNTFAGLFPNANYMISANLLTQTLTPARDTLARQDRRSLEAVDAWLKDPRFQKLAPQLQLIKSRLESFVTQAQTGG